MTTPERRALLTTALGFAQLEWRGETPASIRALHAYLDTWRGLGDVVIGMHAQSCDLELTQISEHWRATFYPTGIADSIPLGSAWETTHGAPCSARPGQPCTIRGRT